MTELEAPAAETWRARVHRWANRATVTGAIAVVLGALVILLPEVGLTIAEYGLGVALVVAGVRDLIGAFRRGTGRGAASRVVLGLRGLGSFVAGGLVLVWTDLATLSLLFLVGVYLVFRGLLQVLLAAVLPSRRGQRLVAGLISLALGLLAVISPRALAGGLTAGAALLAVLVGALLLVYGARAARTDTPDFDPSLTTVVEILMAWIRDADIGDERRAELSEQLYFEPPSTAGKQVAFWTMLLLSVTIATLAVLQDSTAVVIGAMLVAPLMTPILGLAAALVNGWARRLVRSLLLVLGGAVASVVLAMALSTWLPAALAFDTNSQITSRVSPNLLDLLIAVAAGAAGAFATVTTRVSSSIAGVAIAVALVPPLSVVGISLTSGRPADAAGASLLFLTNVVAIILSAVAVFLLAGFAEPAALADRGRRLRRTLLPFAALALVVTVPLLFASEGLLVANDRQLSAEQVVADWQTNPDLVVDSVELEDNRVEVRLSGPGLLGDVEELQEALAAELGPKVSARVVLTPALVREVGP